MLASFLKAIMANYSLAKELREARSGNEYGVIHIRSAERKDLYRIYAIHRYNFPSDSKAILRFILYWIIDPNVIFTAVQNEKVIGYNIYGIAPSELGQGLVHEYFLAVEQEHNGKGIGTQLRSFAHSMISSVGYVGITSQTKTDNLASIKSLETIGFIREFSPLEKPNDSGRCRWRCYFDREMKSR